MNITFTPLKQKHFLLLLKWLETPHVKVYWDKNIHWTLRLIKEKYGDYVSGYKVLKLANKTIKKPMHAFIINLDQQPIGYIQYYNKHDFPPEQGYNVNLPSSCGAIDFYIGELEFINKGIGTQSLIDFIKQHVLQKFDYVFVAPDTENIAAIKTYQKVGFNIYKKVNNDKITLMLYEKELLLKIKQLEESLFKPEIRKSRKLAKITLIFNRFYNVIPLSFK
ncbi:MAG: GNAT family N-acetyltransferase [Rickettsiaceae bacterium]|nr:GNAT family N-acetyltransferase [Rickettsiaceae bacterium]